MFLLKLSPSHRVSLQHWFKYVQVRGFVPIKLALLSHLPKKIRPCVTIGARQNRIHLQKGVAFSHVSTRSLQ
jgi:hypothetical protein